MSRQIRYHRLGAFIYGFLCGVGLILITWGVASIAMLPSRNLMMNIGLLLFGVVLFAVGGCREAYISGSLSEPPEAHIQSRRSQTTNPISEQLIGNPEEIESQKPRAS